MTEAAFLTLLQTIDPDATYEHGIFVSKVCGSHVWVLRSPDYGKIK